MAIERGATKLAQRNDENQKRILSDLKNIGESGSLENIVAAEKAIVKFEIKEYANSKNMAASLKTAQEELEVIETNIGLVSNPGRYKEVDASIGQRKLRDIRDLPLDGARMAFRSHIARLGNYDKARSDDLEKAIVQARQQNIRSAENLYIQRQEKTLGRESGSQPQTMTRAQFDEKMKDFLAQAQKQGADPKLIAAVQKVMTEAIGQQSTKKSQPSKKPRDGQDIER